MSSLAHEGNPKEEEIIIEAGSVLSTAQLDIDFQFFGGDVPNVPEENFVYTLRKQSCAEVFLWPDMLSGRDIMYLRETPASGGNQDRYVDQTLDLEIHSTPNCWGVVWQKYYPLHFLTSTTTAGIAVAWRVSFTGILSGIPRGGPAVWISDDITDPHIATLYAAVVNMNDNVLSVCRWNAESLEALTTPLFNLVVPNPGDLIYMTMDQDPTNVGSNGLTVTLVDSVGTVRDSGFALVEDVMTSTGSQARNSKMGIGFVSVGGPTSGWLAFNTVIGPYTENITTPFLNNANAD